MSQVEHFLQLWPDLLQRILILKHCDVITLYCRTQHQAELTRFDAHEIWPVWLCCTPNWNSTLEQGNTRKVLVAKSSWFNLMQPTWLHQQARYPLQATCYTIRSAPSCVYPLQLHCIVLLCSWVEFILSHCCALSCPACTSLQLQLLHQTTIQGTCPQSFSREGGLYFNYWVTLVQCVKLFKGSLFNLCEGLIES